MKNTGLTIPCPVWNVRSSGIKVSGVSSSLGAPLHRETFEGWLTSAFRPLPRGKTLIIRFSMTYSYHTPIHKHTVFNGLYATCRGGPAHSLHAPDAHVYF